ncbi:MAG: class I SAM-dependent methyltransferase [Anaerolineales bacterium]|nr:MAG: class I SAM-dependent methyltransferase [Anaerolineales bacterium]
MSFYSTFAKYYEEIFPFSPGVFSFLQRYSKPPQRSLDVGCGSGHYAGQLAAQGNDVIGIDLDSAMIDYARQHYPDATFAAMDMRKILELGGGFDFVYCIGNSGAHLPQADFRRFLVDLRKILNPGGQWILQLMNWDYILNQAVVHFPVIKTESDLTFTRAYTHISPASVQFETALMSSKSPIFEDSVPLYPAVSQDVITMHTDLGFIPVAHYGNYAGGAFDPDVFSASIYVFSAPVQ